MIQRHAGKIAVLQTGLITKPVALDYLEGDEYLSISFKPGVFMPRLPGVRMVDTAVFRPLTSRRAFALDSEELEIPTFENAEGLVDRLVKRDIIVRDEIVADVAEGQPRALSPRSVQRHFVHALGLSPKQLAQIQRAKRAVALLRAGRPVVDVAMDLGYADQPHMTRSLKRFIGRTPGEVSSSRRRAPSRRPHSEVVAFVQASARGRLSRVGGMETTPFRIDVKQAVLDDLHDRVARTRWPDEPEGAGWSMGTDLAFMKRLADHWLTRYDWRAQEAALNEHPQFIADVDGTDLHFVHVRGTGPDPTPLLLIHSFPDSFYRFHKVVSLLTDPARSRRRPGALVRRRGPLAARLRLLGAHAAVRG